jgi:glycosyltransferase involved in cell wall biosynthesis
VYRESKGIPALESLANAVPVVLPAHGAFPELIAATRGGLLHEPDGPQALAEALAQLMSDPARATQLGLAGQQAVHRDFHAAGMAEKTRQLYRMLHAQSPT